MINHKANKAKNSNSESTQQQTDKVQIVYYTDPLCCWSWAFEPQWRRLRYEYQDQLTWSYCMGGLIADWHSYDDPMNTISRPFQMGPMWMEAKHLSGMPMMDQIWMTDPPDSSYPACIAVKSAALQSPKAEELYLRALREAVMISGQNIAKDYVLMDIAKKLAEEHPGLLDLERFENDLYGETGPSAFRHDMQKVRYNRIGRFPTLTVQLGDKPGVMITGYRPYNVLLDALRRVVPKISPSITARDPDEYRNYWTHITKRELDEIKSGVDYQKNRSQ